MPRKKEVILYEFSELSEEAKKRAIKDVRSKGTWDDTDSEWLSEQFENDLADYYGLGDMKVGWSLSSSQGDGVCFHGPVDVEKFINAETKKKLDVERFRPLIPFVGAKISTRGRYCHWNSMDIEVDLHGDPGSLLPDDLQSELSSHRFKSDSAMSRWWGEKNRIDHQREDPVREWQLAVDDWVKRLGKPWEGKMRAPHNNPKAWIPGQPPSEPPSKLDIPYPQEPDTRMSDRLRDAYSQAEKEWAKIEKLVPEFQGYLEERIKEISRELEKNGYGEMEYHDTDDYIVEMLENRNWEFLETGERYK